MTEVPSSIEPEAKEIDRTSIIIQFHEKATEKDNLLLIQRPNNGVLANQWEFPGGKSEHGMSLHESVLNEVLEETGLKIPQGQLEYLTMRGRAGEIQHISDTGRNRLVINTPYFYIANVQKLPDITLSDEHQSYMWLQLNEIDRYQVPFPVVRTERFGTTRAIFDKNSEDQLRLTESTNKILGRYLSVYMDDEYAMNPKHFPVYPELWQAARFHHYPSDK